MSQAARYRLDDLRHYAASLATAAGLAPSRGAALATMLLWYESAGRPRFGMASLADLLERIGKGEVDPKAEGSVGQERAATAVLDGRGGVGPLILARAAGIAAEKAREIGVGLVRVRGPGPVPGGPAAAVVAELALGPYVGLAVGPGPSLALALPNAGGLPAVYDSALAETPRAAPPAPFGLLVAEGEWLVQATAVPALESLTALQERVASALGPKAEAAASGALLEPAAWEARRREARERGVAVEAKAWKRLERIAGRLGVAPPATA